jgi:hypothetical protein
VFADPTWPKVQILAMQFIGLTETEGRAVQDFFAATLGLEVGFTDWNGRTWHGIVTTPDEFIIRSSRGGTCSPGGSVDLSFEFDGEIQ